MQRRSFFRNGTLAFLGTGILGHLEARTSPKEQSRTARNIIFLVSDGMSTGTLNMTNLLMQRKLAKPSNWLRLYDEQKVTRALMDTASASSLITDSAAASSSWGGGYRVKNGSLNVSPEGKHHQPILQKFKKAGKAVGCVTTVPITHATPAGFCISNNKRGDQAEIAEQYLDLKFDVMMGGGKQYFSGDSRKDKTDLFQKFRQQGYEVALSKKEMGIANGTKPLLGVFASDGLPYSLDMANDPELKASTPTLAEMTATAIPLLKTKPSGFVLQVEAGKVDWAAHANDAGGLLYDQMAFDEALGVAMAFAEEDKNTLVIVTTDHGNANPGLFYGDKANRNFERLHHFKQTNDWILNGIKPGFTRQQVIERIEYAQGIAITSEQAGNLLGHYEIQDETGLYNPRKLPFRYLAEIQQSYTSIGWGSMDHSADYVELAMYGPGSERLKPFVKNTDLHNLMLEAAALEKMANKNA